MYKVMKFKSIIAATLIGSTLFTTSCKDDFADLNTNPSNISKPNVSYLFTDGLLKFESAGYLLWFYNGRYTSQFVQAYVPTGGLTGTFNQMGATGGQGSQALQVLKLAREVDYILKYMDPKEAAKYEHIRVMFKPLLVYLGMFDTDVYGDMPYTEAAMAPYTSPMLLTPKYDSISDLYSLWLSELDETINVLSKPVVVGSETSPQTSLGSQDFLYKGDATKWAKLANSIKLKIAVRLLHQDKAKAIKIAEEVASSPVGVMNGFNDDFILNKGVMNFHFGDDVSGYGAPTKQVVDFLIKNQDPRVRFFYTKNDFNSKVVQAFFDAGRDLPAYIAENVEYDVVNGKKVFKNWKGLGEPWVRYYGLPNEIDAAQKGEYLDYFTSQRWKISLPGTTEKTFYPYSTFNQEMVRGQFDYTIPTVPGGPVIEDKEDRPWYGMFLSTAEVNLYFAEFSLLGANLPKTAEEYYNIAVERSVLEYNNLASLNKIPYYGTTYAYDDNESVIDLKDGEIATLKAKADYKFSGTTAEKLEKVYIQQYLHFMYQPTDQFVTVRRSGVPKVNSSLIAWRPIIESTNIPRRFEISLPNETDLMYDIKTASLKSQGFTGGQGITPSLLNTERVWQDKGAPNFGAGPNF